MHDHAFHYSLADTRYFDDPWNSPELLQGQSMDVVDHELPAPWRRSTRGPWLGYFAGHELPATGWKIHVAATPDTALKLAEVVRDLCLQHDTSWKILATVKLVCLSQHKYAPRTGCGKVVTIYPHNDAVLDSLLAQLRVRLRGWAGPAPVGEICAPEAPVAVRWGAFTETWTRDRAGRPVPGMHARDGVAADRRGRLQAPDNPPPGITDLVRESQEWDRTNVLSATDIKLISRNNTGAVYSARDIDGHPIILKEARHHCGVSPDGSDAVSRLRHEHRVLTRLAGLGVAPEPRDLLTCGRSDFLVMSLLPGTPLNAWVAHQHPSTGTKLDDGCPWQYLQRTERIHRRLLDALGIVHARGVIHRDLHPSNVMIGPDDHVSLIDFESATVDGVSVVTPGGAPGFKFSESGRSRDDRGAQRLLLMMRNPLVSVLDARPDAEAELHRAIDEDAGARPRQHPTRRLNGAALIRGLIDGATPRRGDRLYPGSLDQFEVPGGGTGLLTGAAGVLLTILAYRQPPPMTHLQWLLDQPQDRVARHRGLGHGADGVALALARGGALDQARDVVEQMLQPRALAPTGHGWAYGHAGCAWATLQLAELLSDERLLDVGRAHLDECLAALRHPQAAISGLMHGWAGLGLTLSTFRGHPSLETPDAVLDDAMIRCHDLELAGCLDQGEMLLGVKGRRAYPYLGIGSAALGILAAHLVDLGLHPAAETTRDKVHRTLQRPVVMAAGLVQGRAGVLLALAAIAPDDPMVGVHEERLRWHVVGDQRSAEVLGEFNLRRSLDLQSGSAGVLLSTAPRQAQRLLLPLPLRTNERTAAAE